ncbi:hypothetical protein [Halomonas shantousis]
MVTRDWQRLTILAQQHAWQQQGGCLRLARPCAARSGADGPVPDEVRQALHRALHGWRRR